MELWKRERYEQFKDELFEALQLLDSSGQRDIRLPETRDGRRVKVRAYDADTRELIPSATITCGSRSGSNPATFTKLPLGTYNPSASAPGYLSASGSVTLTDVDADKEIDLFLVKSTGDVTVCVYDSETNRPISGASVSGTTSGTTDSNGRCVFKDIPFGTIKFTASASGYYSDSGTAAISRTNRFDTVTIYLDPIPTTGDITVKVVDADNGYAISGAYVSGAGESGMTDSSGCVVLYDIPFGNYTFTASADGYYSGSTERLDFAFIHDRHCDHFADTNQD